MFKINHYLLIGLFILLSANLSLSVAVPIEESQKALTAAVIKNNIGAIVGTNKQTALALTGNQASLVTNEFEGRVMVRLSPLVSIQQFQNSLLSVKNGDEIDIVKVFPLRSTGYINVSGSSRIVVLQADTKSTKDVMSLVKSLSGVERVEPDFIQTTHFTPNDALFDSLWGMQNNGQTGGTPNADINASAAWDLTTGSNNVVVGVIDTGIDYFHPDLVGNLWLNPAEIPNNGVDDDVNGYIDDIYGIDTINADSDPLDDNRHGTHVSGTIGAKGDNNIGVVGVNHSIQIVACKFLSASGSGFTSDAIECLEYFTALKTNGVNIVATNNSWGGGGFSQLLKDAIDNAGAAGILFVAASGNSASDNDIIPHYPSSYDSDSILSVAATNDDDNMTFFSSYGLTSVDLAAPGESILSTILSIGNACLLSSDMVWNESFSDPLLPGWERFAYDTRNPPLTNRPDLWWQHLIVENGIDDSLNSDYQNYLFTSITHETPIDLSGKADILCLGLEIKGENESFYDRLGVYITANDGINWSLVGFIDESNIADWTSFTFTIPEAFKTSDFRVSFVRTSDFSIIRSGYQIRNIQLTENSTIDRIAQYTYLSGTSMAAPHVTGAIALAASVVPNETATQRKTRVLDNVDVLPQLSGLIVTSGRLNVYNMIPAPVIPGVRSDFNSDGKADLIWRHNTNGANILWYMDNNTKIGNTSIPSLANIWELVAVDDFNADGKPDLVWRHKTNGVNIIWYMDDNTKIGSAAIPSLANIWKLVGVDDFNADGKPDLVWRHKTNGANVIWYMDNNTKLSSASITSLANTWKLVGIEDFNADGKPDLVWRHDINGANVLWYMDNNTKIGNASIASLPTVWQMIGTNDFNGDSKPDLVWRKNSGENVLWYMDNNTKIGNSNIPFVPTVWELIVR